MSPPLRQIKLLSLSISISNSIFELGSNLFSNDSKKEYLLRGISQFAVDDGPISSFLLKKPSLKLLFKFSINTLGFQPLFASFRPC